MIIRRRTQVDTIEVGSTTATLVARVYTLGLGGRHGGGGWIYHRPCRVEVTGDPPVRRRLHDHVMLARLAAIVAVVSCSLLGRRIHHVR